MVKRASWAIALVLIVYVADASMGPNAFSLPFQSDLVRQVLPQKWEFFTRDPREPNPRVYEDGFYRQNRLFDRSDRAYSLELGLVLNEVPGRAWQSCDDVIPRCAARMQRVAVRNPARRRRCAVATSWSSSRRRRGRGGVRPGPCRR